LLRQWLLGESLSWWLLGRDGLLGRVSLWRYLLLRRVSLHLLGRVSLWRYLLLLGVNSLLVHVSLLLLW
jgi:hypothetical protein